MNTKHIEKLKESQYLSVSNFAQVCGISRSQLNRELKTNEEVRRSLDNNKQYVAHISEIEKRALPSGIAYLGGHVFSVEEDMISAMKKCISESRFGRSRDSLEDMFRCKDLGKSFVKLEKLKEIVMVKISHKILYLFKDKAQEQIKTYHRKKGVILREKEKEAITIALIFSVIDYEDISSIEQKIRKKRNKGGRQPYPFKAMINAILCMTIKKWKYSTTLARELDNDSGLATALGFNPEKGTPSSSCFTRFIQAVGNHIKANVDIKLQKLLEKKKQLKKENKKIKSSSSKIKRTKPHRRNYIPIVEIEAEIQELNKKIKDDKKEVSTNGWYHIFSFFVTKLLTLRIIDGKFVCLDSTHVNVTRKDPNQSYGVKSTRKLEDGSIKIVKDFFGYKLHIAVDAKTSLPVAITITTGCVADNKEGPKIIRQLKQHGVFFKKFLTDGGYNDKKIYREIHEFDKKAKFICPANEQKDEPLRQYYYDEKTGQRYQIYYNTEKGRWLHRLRGPTENINKIIKCDLDMDKPRRRGIRAIESLAYIHCIAILILAIASKLTDRAHLTNQFSKVV